MNLSTEERAKLLVDFNEVEISDDEKAEESSPGTDKENRDSSCDPPVKRRKVFVFDSEDSEDEYKPEKVEESDEDDVSSGVDSNTEDMEPDPEPEDVEESPPRGVKRKRNQSVRSNKKPASALKCTPTNSPRPSYSGSVSESTKAKLSLFKNVSNFYIFFWIFMRFVVNLFFLTDS